MYKRSCRRCSVVFQTHKSNVFFCSADCRKLRTATPGTIDKIAKIAELPVAKNCLHCGLPISPLRLNRSWTKYCSRRCSQDAMIKSGPKSEYPGLPSLSVGAIHELLVAADLLSKGFQVFRALSASCDCDLAALLNGKLIRIEVTTGYLSLSGRLSYPKHTKDNFDIIAVVCRKQITYFPDLPTSGAIHPTT